MNKAPPPPPPPRKGAEGARVVMKGQTLKEALEYNPQPKKKFSTLSQEDRVKRLKQELADMEKLMRTGIGSSSLASGPSSAPADDEYVPQPPIPLPKKMKKPKKRERPPPPPPKKEILTLPITSDIPPPPSGPPPKRVKETKPLVDVPPPPPPRTVRVEKPATEESIVEPVDKEQSAEPQPPSPTIPIKQTNSPTVRKREPSFSKDPIKKRILNDFPTDESSDPFDSFGAAGPTQRPPQRYNYFLSQHLRQNINLGNQSFKMIYLTLNLVLHYPTLSRQMKLNQMRKMNGL